MIEVWALLVFMQAAPTARVFLTEAQCMAALRGRIIDEPAPMLCVRSEVPRDAWFRIQQPIDIGRAP